MITPPSIWRWFNWIALTELCSAVVQALMRSHAGLAFSI